MWWEYQNQSITKQKYYCCFASHETYILYLFRMCSIIAKFEWINRRELYRSLFLLNKFNEKNGWTVIKSIDNIARNVNATTSRVVYAILDRITMHVCFLFNLLHSNNSAWKQIVFQLLEYMTRLACLKHTFIFY